MVLPPESSTKQHLLHLVAQREKLERKISDYGALLEANANVGMAGPLVDAQGYPRNDIDVYQVRQARQQIICLQNDHKSLMKDIEKWMHKLHAETAAAQQEQQVTQRTAEMQLDDDDADESVERNGEVEAFAEINLVSAGSPAEDAGLCIGDKIIEFGSVNARNFNNDLMQIASVVRHMQNQRVSVKVRRTEQILDLILIPRTWGGRGLLGCNIVLANAMQS